MRNMLAGLLASVAVLRLASSAFAFGDCSFGHSKQVMASTVDDEAATMSTFDGDVKLPEEVAESDDAAVIVPSEDETTGE